MTSAKITSRNLLLVNIALSAVFIVIQTAILTWLGISLVNAVIDSSVSYILLSAICYNLGNILRYYRPGKSRFFYVFIWDLAISGVWLLIVNWILSYIIKDASYLAFLPKSLPVRFFVAFLITGWFAMISWVIYSNEEQQLNEK